MLRNRGFGIGVDLELVSRFERLRKTDPLIKKMFTSQEIAYCFIKRKLAQHLAARFAATEAAMKALRGRFTPLDYNKIEVRSTSGAPTLSINIRKYRDYEAHVSLSHVKDYALAFVLVQKPIV